VIQAWARPLAGITSYQADVEVVPGFEWFGWNVRLTFSDIDELVELPPGRAM
jgi:hypothetical protein